ncbi:MAG: GNAT family N-acetyltransferase, partial [Bacteroidia bacterium]
MGKLLIHTDRLQIRNLQPSDLAGFHRYRSNPEVTQYQGFDVMDEAECQDFIRSQANRIFGNPGEWVQYAIAKKDTDELVGDCAINLEKDPRIAHVGITLSHLEQRKGYAKEALLAIMAFLFDKNDVHRIEEIADDRNTASIALLESCGFRKEGHFIENIFFK